MAITLAQLAEYLGGTVIGDATTELLGISPLDEIQVNTLVYAKDANAVALVEKSEAAAILVNNNCQSSIKPCIQVSDPFHAFTQIIAYVYPTLEEEPGIHPTAVIADNVSIGKLVHIGPYVTIGSGSVIGDKCIIHAHASIGQQVVLGNHCVIHPHVTIYNQCRLHNEVIVHASSVIGCDGFGYRFHEGKHEKIPHVGHVVIEDHVEIGANTVIDRATLGATVIGQGSKIDNLVQVAHSVKLGKNNILCAFTGIAGSCNTGNNVVFAANVGVSDHVTIEDGVTLGARTGVAPNKILKANQVYLGNPARPKDKFINQEMENKRIPAMRKKIEQLEEQLKKLAQAMEQTEV
ncbi:UDP-3-O-(3-hydroxymyristoyl)glucosamine N-acyltransferase [Legionella sp. W05-934-2]|uniref:UDP-3-O-(3-hydroxymyristoyl)glucosamine N-acyltransferase n=1 Tax=Legionella sp. W05-934-2 TaxID=1198649 RepID=UPI003461F391